MSDRRTYVQRLEALGMSIERGTSDVPPDSFFYLLKDGAVIGRYRSLKMAKAAWDMELAASGWKPPAREDLSPAEKLERDKAARDRWEKAEHWDRLRRRR